MCDHGDTASLCRAAVRELTGRFKWQLLPEQEFVARSAKTLAEKPALKPIQACQNVYSQVLYDACRDARQQEQAYRELHAYLYRIACCRRPDVVEDATQAALLLIFEQIDACRNPGAFLRFAQFKLLQAIKTSSTHLGRESELAPDDFSSQPPEEFEPPDEKIDALWRCIRRIWETHPRAHDQLQAVLWKYFDELSDEEIAERLNGTPAQVHVLRSRGMKRLRQCVAGQESVETREFSGQSARNRVGRAL